MDDAGGGQGAGEHRWGRRQFLKLAAATAAASSAWPYVNTRVWAQTQQQLRAWALVIFRDHRAESVRASIDRMRRLLPTAIRGVTVREIVPLRILYGEPRPYHVLIQLEASSGDLFKQAFDYIEKNFSHVDGFG